MVFFLFFISQGSLFFCQFDPQFVLSGNPQHGDHGYAAYYKCAVVLYNRAP